jgi:hypothetical protein
MAHFAKIGLDNKVIHVVTVDNIDCMTPQGIEKEEIGLAHLRKHHGHETWKQCSFTSIMGKRRDPKSNQIVDRLAFRANFPGIGWYYNSEYDIFHPPKPEGCNSWTLNTTNGWWEPPIKEPEITKEQGDMEQYYVWDEEAYQADNTTGWVLVTPE